MMVLRGESKPNAGAAHRFHCDYSIFPENAKGSLAKTRQHSHPKSQTIKTSILAEHLNCFLAESYERVK
jgi:hypothetical protein